MGLLVFFNPGSLEQLTLGLIVCFCYCVLCSYLLPFGSITDNLMVCKPHLHYLPHLPYLPYLPRPP